MALALEGFSIREYAANTRRVDFDKCWPFDGGGGGGRRSLPEISVRKFRFWEDEVKAVRAAATPTPSKGKQRTPKKRSIVELFAVAPQIETAADDDDDDEEEEEEEEEGKEEEDVEERKGKEEAREGGDPKGEKRSKKKRKVVVIKRKHNKPRIEICAAKKEKNKSLHSPMHKLLSGKRNKNLGDSAKNQPTRRKLKLLKSSKPISKKQKEPGKVLKAHGKVKNPSKGNKKKAGVKTNKEGGHLISFCRESEKGSTLPGSNDILGHTQTCSPIDIPQLRSLCKIFSDVLAASSALEDRHRGEDVPAAADLPQTEYATGSNISENTIERNKGTPEGQQISESHSDITPHVRTHPNYKSFSDTAEASFTITANENSSAQVFNDGGKGSAKHLDDPKVLENTPSEGVSSQSDNQVIETCPRTSNMQSLLTSLERCASRSDATGCLSLTRNQSPLNLETCSAIRKEDMRKSQQLNPLSDCWQITGLHAKHPLPSKGLVDNGHAPVKSRQVQRPVPSGNDKPAGERFFGLPLNSQGELIHVNSSAKFGFVENSGRHSGIQGSAQYYPTPGNSDPRPSADQVLKGKFTGITLNQKDQSTWYQEPYLHLSRPAITGCSYINLQEFDRCGVQRNAARDENIFFHNHNPREVQCHGCREDTRTQNYIDRVNFQPEGNIDRVQQPKGQHTMRLMGTNVTVSGSNKGSQSCHDGKIWTDKEIVANSFVSMGVSNRPPPHHWQQQQWVQHQSNGMARSNLCHPVDASSTLYHMPAIAPRMGLSQFDYRPPWISRNGTFSATGDQCLKVNFVGHPHNSQSFLNESSKSTVNSIPGLTSFKVGNQFPVVNPPSRPHQPRNLSSTHCNSGQGTPYCTTTTFRPPFFNEETRSSFQSSQNLPQWMLSAKQKKSQESSCSCYSGQLASQHYINGAHSDLFHVQSPRLSSTIQFSVPAAITSQRSGLCTASFRHSSLVPPNTTSKSGSAVENSSRNQNMNRAAGTNLNFTYLKSMDSSRETRKRPPTKDDGFMKPTKKPFFKTLEAANATTGPGPEEMHGSTLDGKKTTDPISPEVTNEKEDLSTLSLSCAAKVDTGPKSGPIKLSAGAKHILKPSDDVNQDNSRPTFSTIPFSVGNTSGKALDPPMKAAEIYRF